MKKLPSINLQGRARELFDGTITWETKVDQNDANGVKSVRNRITIG
jgi:hypothetical protein